MSEKEIRLLALFFYLAFLDPQKTLELTTKAYKECLEHWEDDPVKEKILIKCIYDNWKKALKRGYRVSSHFVYPSEIKIPETTKIDVWHEFQRFASHDEVLSLLIVKVLQFDAQIFSEVTGIPFGTIHHRVSKAIRKLGMMSSSQKRYQGASV